MQGFLEDMQLAKLHQWFVEKEVITWDNVVAALSEEMNLTDEIVQKLYEHMKPTAKFTPTTYQTPSNNMTLYCKEYNGIHSFLCGCVVCVRIAVVCVCVYVCVYFCVCSHMCICTSVIAFLITVIR